MWYNIFINCNEKWISLWDVIFEILYLFLENSTTYGKKGWFKKPIF